MFKSGLNWTKLDKMDKLEQIEKNAIWDNSLHQSLLEVLMLSFFHPDYTPPERISLMQWF